MQCGTRRFDDTRRSGLTTCVIASLLCIGCGDRGYDGIGSPPDQVAAADVLLVAGPVSHGLGEHEYLAGANLLVQLLEQSPGVRAASLEHPWPEDSAIFAGKRSIVLLTNGNTSHPFTRSERMDALEPYVAAGMGLVAIHWSVHLPPREESRNLAWLGGFYHEDVSVNPKWTARFTALPEHPITRGVTPFELRDEWYYNMRFAPERDGLTPILQAVPPDSTRETADARMYPGRAETTAWALERQDGGRSFGITGAHFHDSYGSPEFRRIIVNAILWTAGHDVPAAGAPVELDDGALVPD